MAGKRKKKKRKKKKEKKEKGKKKEDRFLYVGIDTQQLNAEPACLCSNALYVWPQFTNLKIEGKFTATPGGQTNIFLWLRGLSTLV